MALSGRGCGQADELEGKHAFAQKVETSCMQSQRVFQHGRPSPQERTSGMLVAVRGDRVQWMQATAVLGGRDEQLLATDDYGRMPVSRDIPHCRRRDQTLVVVVDVTLRGETRGNGRGDARTHRPPGLIAAIGSDCIEPTVPRALEDLELAATVEVRKNRC